MTVVAPDSKARHVSRTGTVSRYLSIMFNRYSIANTARLTSRFLARADPDLQRQPRYNVVRGDVMPIVVNRGGTYWLEAARWGLVPAWSQRPTQGFITAHRSTVAERPSSKQAFQSQRCLVPATSFFSIQTSGERHRAHLFHLVDEPIVSFAGLFDRWLDPDGTELQTFAMIVCQSNTLVQPTSDIMPAILRRGDERLWLDPRLTDVPFLQSLIEPVPSMQMRTYRVSTAVLSPDNDSPDLIRPISDGHNDRYFPDLS